VEVEGFRPTPSDLEYPEKLEAYWEAKLGGREGGREDIHTRTLGKIILTIVK